MPTTNIRPEIAGSTWSKQLLKLLHAWMGQDSLRIYSIDSLLCELAELAGSQKIREDTEMVSDFSLIFAVLIIISTQVLKQHYLVDAIAGVGLVELSWRFYSNGNHHDIFRSF